MKKYIRSGIVAKKVGISSFFEDDGRIFPVTILSLEDCCVVSARQDLDNGRVLLQVGSGLCKKISKPLAGHFSKNGIDPRKILRTFCVHPDYDLSPGSCFQADYFPEGSYVDVSGVTIGRGFAGVMKRHGFGGLRASHGVSVSHRSHGSTGHRKDPSRVFKGKKMAGHMGCVRVTVQSLKIVHTDVDRGLVFVKGNSVPGFEGGWVSIRDAVKKCENAPSPSLGIRILDDRSVHSDTPSGD
jgi:large subunit ribosomal protein L3